MRSLEGLAAGSSRYVLCCMLHRCDVIKTNWPDWLKKRSAFEYTWRWHVVDMKERMVAIRRYIHP